MSTTPSSGPSGACNTSGHEAQENKKDALNRLIEKQVEELDTISKKIEMWKKYKQDYLDLKQLIGKMQDKVRHPYRVPIAGTKMAYVEGHIVHTNEIHVLLGYNYFALRSAKQASQIIDRRLNEINIRTREQEDARKKTQDWLNVTQDHKREKEEFVEIIETM